MDLIEEIKKRLPVRVPAWSMRLIMGLGGLFGSLVTFFIVEYLKKKGVIRIIEE